MMEAGETAAPVSILEDDIEEEIESGKWARHIFLSPPTSHAQSDLADSLIAHSFATGPH